MGGPAGALWSAAKNRATRAHLPFNIQHGDIWIPECCPVLRIPLLWSAGGRTDNTPSLDRIQPALGYVVGNVEVISWRANRLKSDASLAELRLMHTHYCQRTH